MSSLGCVRADPPKRGLTRSGSTRVVPESWAVTEVARGSPPGLTNGVMRVEAGFPIANVVLGVDRWGEGDFDNYPTGG